MSPTSARARLRRRSSGFTLIEMLVAGLVSTLLGAALWTLIRSSYDSQWLVMNQNGANSNARLGVDTLADEIRGAKSVSSATANNLVFTDNTGASVHYWVSTGGLLRSTGTGKVVAPFVTSVSFVYWTWSGTAWVSSTAPTTPANVGAIDFTVTSTMNGVARQISGSARLRQK